MHLNIFRRVALIAATAALCALTPAHDSARSDPAAGDSPASKRETVRDGSHDFDFIYGKWRMPNHRLKKRLAGSNDWADFITCDEGNPLPGGIGNIDYWITNYWKDFVLVTVRTYDTKSGLWRIYGVDNTFSGGAFEPPVVGKFDGNVGIFEGPGTFNGTPILMRYTWTVSPKDAQAQWEKALNPKDAKVVAKWEQAFSTDGGKTWETNWYNEFIRDDHCTP